VKAIAVVRAIRTARLQRLSTKSLCHQPRLPPLLPAPGKYTGSVVVTISDTTANAIIHYTLDGSTPLSSSPVYVGPLNSDPLHCRQGYRYRGEFLEELRRQRGV